jgi:GAF domain-containing protein
VCECYSCVKKSPIALLPPYLQPYQNKVWDSTWDKTLQIKTRAIMCSPIFDRDGEVIGAITVINKKNGDRFTEVAYLCSTLAQCMAIASAHVMPHSYICICLQADEHRLQAINSHIGIAVEEALLDSKSGSAYGKVGRF